jgi:hypothetical protein
MADKRNISKGVDPKRDHKDITEGGNAAGRKVGSNASEEPTHKVPVHVTEQGSNAPSVLAGSSSEESGLESRPTHIVQIPGQQHKVDIRMDRPSDERHFHAQAPKPMPTVTDEETIVKEIDEPITSEASAKSFIKKGGFKIPKDTKVVFVTSDRNLFTGENESTAINHAQKQKLQIFRLTSWD